MRSASVGHSAYTDFMEGEIRDITDLPQSQADFLNGLIRHRDRFLRFLASRVKNVATAEDVLQSAYVKALEHGSEIRENESAVAWFYRILRNALIDQYRRQATQAKALETFAAETPESYEHQLRNVACLCIGDVIDDLRPDYRSAIEGVDLGGLPVEEFAKSAQISANNASVRLHRARKAVAKHLTTICGVCAEHKCVDCTCRRSQV